jgi:hypothetical protein
MTKLVRIAALCTFGLFIAGCALDEGGPASAGDDPAGAAEETSEAIQDLAETTCGHSICETGAAVSSTCDTCVVNICSADPFCCSTSWDGLCVAEVGSICGLGPVAVSSTTPVSSINVRITTGGDDLRGGSQAYGSFQVTGGATLPRISLNGGAGFPGNSVRTATIPLPVSRTLGSLTGFALEWDGAPRNIFDTYDNWNADELRFFITPGGPGRCPNFLGAAFAPGRMTGSRTLASTVVHFP